MSITARPQWVASDATSLIVFVGEPNAPIQWLVVGNGTLYPLHTITDINGIAAAKLVPTGEPGDQITVTARYA